jgi:3-oxoacyl-[acyl-carrier protein] reductase
MRLKNKVCIITGAARGIGKATALRFLGNGAKLIICDLDDALVQSTVKELSEYGETTGFAVDITKPDDIRYMVNEVLKASGRIDVLVNNAGITSDAQLVKMTFEQFDRVIDVNLKGTFNCTKEVAPAMIRQGKGKIINISSVVGLFGNFGQTNYAASKFGVIGMTKTWAKELGRKNINVNAVAPGFIMTEMTMKMPDNVLDMMKEKSPLKKLGTPEDVANACLFLSSDESDFVHGAVICVDGGIVI